MGIWGGASAGSRPERDAGGGGLADVDRGLDGRSTRFVTPDGVRSRIAPKSPRGSRLFAAPDCDTRL
jgi:hypothetical protein